MQLRKVNRLVTCFKSLCVQISLYMEEVNALRNQLCESDLQNTRTIKNFDDALKDANAKIEKLDVENKRLDLSLANEVTTTSTLRLSLQNAEKLASNATSQSSGSDSVTPHCVAQIPAAPGLPNPECERKCENY